MENSRKYHLSVEIQHVLLFFPDHSAGTRNKELGLAGEWRGLGSTWLKPFLQGSWEPLRTNSHSARLQLGSGLSNTLRPCSGFFWGMLMTDSQGWDLSAKRPGRENRPQNLSLEKFPGGKAGFLGCNRQWGSQGSFCWLSWLLISARNWRVRVLSQRILEKPLSSRESRLAGGCTLLC